MDKTLFITGNFLIGLGVMSIDKAGGICIFLGATYLSYGALKMIISWHKSRGALAGHSGANNDE